MGRNPLGKSLINGLMTQPSQYGGFQLVMGVPLYRWMVFVNGKIPVKLVTTGGTPMTMEITIGV